MPKATGSSAASAEPQKGQPADKSHKVTIDHNNPGRVMLRSRASERAVAAQDQLRKLTKSGISQMTDEKLSQLAKDLGLHVRGTGASGDVTRGDYTAALHRVLPVPAKTAGK